MWVNPKLAIKPRKFGPAMQFKVGARDINGGRAAADIGLCFESHPIVRWPGTSQISG
jgi:hypothetical protein